MGIKEVFKIHLVLAILLTVTHRGWCADYDYGETESDVVSTCIRLNSSTKRTTVAGEGALNLVDFLENGTSELFPVSEEVPEDVVLILGNSGSGKTTLTQMIAGDLSKLHAANTEGGTIVIVDEDEKIGAPGTTSRTIIPELVISQNESFYDCPGFNDNRGALHDLAVNYFMNQITERVRRVKLIFLIKFNSVRLGQDRDNFDGLVTHATKFVKNLSNFQTSVGLVVTKVDHEIKQNGIILTLGKIKLSIVDFITVYKNDIQERLDSTEDDKERDLILRKVQFVKILLNRNDRKYNNIAMSISPGFCGRLNESEIVDGTRKRVLDMIRKLNFTEVGNPVANFGFTLKDQTIRKVKEVYINETNQAVNLKISEQMEHFMSWYNTVHTNSLESLPIVGFKVLNIWENVDNLEVEDSIYLTNIAQDLCLGFTAMGYNCSQEFADFMAEKQTYFEFFDRATDSQLNRDTNKWLQTVNAVKDKVRGEREQFKLEILSKWVKEVNNLITARVQVEANSIKEWIDSKLRDVDGFGVISNQTWDMLSMGHKFKVDTDAFNSATELADYIANLTTRIGDIRVSEEFVDNLSQANRTFEFFEDFLKRNVSRELDAWAKPLLAIQHKLDMEKDEYLRKVRNDYAPNSNIRTEQCFSRVKDYFTERFNMEKAQEKNNYPRVSLRMQAIWNVSVPTSLALNASAVDIYESYRSTLEKIGYILSNRYQQCVKNETKLLNHFEYITQENLTRHVLSWLIPLGQIQSEILKNKENYFKLLDTEFIPNANDQIATALDKTLKDLHTWLETSMDQNTHSIESLETFVTKVNSIKDSLKNVSKRNSTFIEDLKSAFGGFGFIPPAEFQQITKCLADLKLFEELKGYPVLRNTDAWKQTLLQTIDNLDNMKSDSLRRSQPFIDELNKDIESQISSVMKNVMDGLDKAVTGRNNSATLQTLQSTFNQMTGFRTSKNLNEFCRNIQYSFSGYLGTTIPNDFTSKCFRNEELFQKLYRIRGNDLSRDDSKWQSPLLSCRETVQDFISWYELCGQVSTRLAQYDFQMEKPEESRFSTRFWATFLHIHANILVSERLRSFGDELMRENSVHFDKLIQLVRQALNPVRELCENQSFIVTGNYIVFSKTIRSAQDGSNKCSPFKNLEIYASNRLFVDETFRAYENEVSFVFVAPDLEVVGQPTINLSGRNGESHFVSASSGKYTGANEYVLAGYAVGYPVYTEKGSKGNVSFFTTHPTSGRWQDGPLNNPNSKFHRYLQSLRSGSDGRAGRAGGHGGHLLAVFSRITRASNLHVVSNGGNGGKGQDGGAGVEGPGCLQGLNEKCDSKTHVGGNGGDGGIGGSGGKAGSIQIFGQNSHLVRVQMHIGENGLPGIGGRAGIGGRGANSTVCNWIICRYEYGLNSKDGEAGRNGASGRSHEVPKKPAERKELSYAKRKYLSYFGNEITDKIFY